MQSDLTSPPPTPGDTIQAHPASTEPRTLPRAMGPYMAIAVVVGTVIGSGVFKKPAAIADNLPNFGFVALVWVLGGCLAMLGALSIAEVAVLYPRAGGNYVFLREGYGRLFGFLWGWVEFWIIRCASIAALATIFTESLHDVLRITNGLQGNEAFLSPWALRGMTVAVIVVLALVNIRGVRWGGGLQICITAVKIGSLMAIILLPFIYWGQVEEAEASAASLRPLPVFSWAGLGVAMISVQWAYHGWMNIGPIAGEVERPQRNLPLGVIGGVGIVIALYLGANIAYHLIIPQGEMRLLTASPVATEFSRRLLGAAGVAFASAAVMFSTFGALNGNLLVGPRLLYAMGHDQLAPRALAAIHPRYQTPAMAIAVEALWSCLLVIGVAQVSGEASGFDDLTDFAMFGAIIFETMAVSTIFVFRWRYPRADRPYRCFGYPVVPAVYVLVLTAVAVNTLNARPMHSQAGLVFIAFGALVYFAVFRHPKPMSEQELKPGPEPAAECSAVPDAGTKIGE